MRKFEQTDYADYRNSRWNRLQAKTTVVNKILASFPAGEVAVIPQDYYYKDSSHIPPEERSKINFDEPNAIEWTLLVEQLQQLREGARLKCRHIPI